MFTVVTGRYNNDTWHETEICRARIKRACIYGPPNRLSETIPISTPVYVIEMNNSINQIMGIGLINNKVVTDKVYRIHKDTNFNRYIYIGDHHLSRELLELYHPHLVAVLDEILFKGYTHSKRGSGLMRIPEKALTHDICKDIDIKREIRTIFIRHYKDNIKAEQSIEV
ncbi:MAG: hypothetical protein ACOVRN_16920 [Flavobacterium sp.]